MKRLLFATCLALASPALADTVVQLPDRVIIQSADPAGCDTTIRGGQIITCSNRPGALSNGNPGDLIQNPYGSAPQTSHRLNVPGCTSSPPVVRSSADGGVSLGNPGCKTLAPNESLVLSPGASGFFFITSGKSSAFFQVDCDTAVINELFPDLTGVISKFRDGSSPIEFYIEVSTTPKLCVITNSGSTPRLTSFTQIGGG